MTSSGSQPVLVLFGPWEVLHVIAWSIDCSMRFIYSYWKKQKNGILELVKLELYHTSININKSERFDFDKNFITKSKDTVSWFPCFVLFGHPNSAQLTEPPLCHAAGSCAFTHAAPWFQLTGHLPSLYVFSFRFYDSHDWSFAHTNISAIEIGLPDQSGGRRWSNSLPRTSIICAPAWKSGTLFPLEKPHKVSVKKCGIFHFQDSIQQIL